MNMLLTISSASVGAWITSWEAGKIFGGSGMYESKMNNSEPY